MQDISGFGTIINIIASSTYPIGVIITQSSNDVDPLDIPSIKIASAEMGVNGDLQVWATAVPIDISVSVVVGSLSDEILQILFDNNRVGAGKNSSADVITLSAIYPDASVISVLNGRCTEYMPGKSIAGSGRMKTRTYKFVFESKIGGV